MAASPVRVILADDHPLIRDGLRSMLDSAAEVKVVAEAANGRELIELVEIHKPDVVVSDIRMPELDGLEALRRIRLSHPDVKFLMLTVHDENAYVYEAISAGALGYLLKTTSSQELLKGILAVASGKAMLHPTVTQQLINQFAQMARGDARPKELSKRERDVLQLLAYGKANKEIAKALGIGAQTVKTHISHIFTKLGAADRTDAVALALRKGLVQ